MGLLMYPKRITAKRFLSISHQTAIAIPVQVVAVGHVAKFSVSSQLHVLR
jgi:hypothetical protein